MTDKQLPKVYFGKVPDIDDKDDTDEQNWREIIRRSVRVVDEDDEKDDEPLTPAELKFLGLDSNEDVKNG
jgi:hypothetical protein